MTIHVVYKTHECYENGFNIRSFIKSIINDSGSEVKEKEKNNSSNNNNKKTRIPNKQTTNKQTNYLPN
jgi:membrane-bound lytic murein transglycosylase MltF